MKVYIVKCILCTECWEESGDKLRDSYVDVFTDKFEAEFAIELYKEKIDRPGSDIIYDSYVSTFEIIEKEL